MEYESAILHLQKDQSLRIVLDNITIVPFTPSGKVYFDLLESIVSQQLSVKAAKTIFNRFCALFPDQYPHPELLQVMDSGLLRTAGVSGQKATYLKNVAVFTLENDLENYPWDTLEDQDIINLLTQIKGVGLWTSEMILMFTLGRSDILPLDDLGIQQAMIRLFSLQENNKRQLRQRMIELAEPWRPFRTLACRYLWRWKDSA